MRDEDVEEAWAIGLTPLDALTQSIHGSTLVYTMIGHEGVPISIVGVSPSPYPNWGLIWMLGTPGIVSNKITFLRHSRAALVKMFEETGSEVLYNYTYAKNKVHHDWLRWLGFTFIRKVSLLPHGEEFYEFAKIRG
ncbi:hypothetical protein UFOVP63_29 [uncultured Caudovirales phage]|uniref:DUF2833 domain-containing protein n=1 Tax=uncultured Caudovirales phage TaxID=2100421 RepID=A0A6J5KUG2_9CAUD|nr:hypothetical protein UFOVP63_29 [uncultured Caudovirales phage]